MKLGTYFYYGMFDNFSQIWGTKGGIFLQMWSFSAKFGYYFWKIWVFFAKCGHFLQNLGIFLQIVVIFC